MTSTDTTAQTPQEIDTYLAANWTEQMKVRTHLAWAKDTVRREAGQRKTSYAADAPWSGTYQEAVDACEANDTFTADSGTTYRSSAGKALDKVENLDQQLLALHLLAAPGEDEYRARRWNRYFLVNNASGHVHRERECSTCYDTTQFSWLPELSGCDEATMVAEYGEMACTVCFPNAPVHKGFGDGTSTLARYSAAEKAERKAAKEARQAAKAAKTLEPTLQFREVNGTWKVETVAAAKQSLRDAAVLLAGYGYDHQRAEAPRVKEEARRALLAKGMTQEEIDTIETRAVKTATKRGY
jgi:hypothetical protein